MKKNLLFLLIALSMMNVVNAQFTSGNIAAIMVASNSSSNTTASIVELNPATLNSTPVNTYAINGTTGSDAMRFSGSATSTCYLTNSNDGSLLCFTGANTTTSTGNTNTILTRSVGTFNTSGTFNIAATYTGASGNQPRSATTSDNSVWFIADQGGVYTNNATSASPTGNYRAMKSFGGNVYVSASSSTVISISSVSAASGGTVTPLPGLVAVSSLTDYYFIQSGVNGVTYDVLYILSASSATVGTIQKLSLVAGVWADNGSYTTSFGGFGLAAKATATGAILFVSSGTGATSGNSVIRLTDDSSYNQMLSINSLNNLTLFTAASGTTIKGVAFAPTTPLAIHLTDINASNNNKQNIINWNTGHEDRGDYFELMRSADGNQFSTIATIHAKGENSKYSYVDAQPLSGTTYYRLKMIDNNGNANYSKIVSVKMNGISSNNMMVAPNPITGNNLHLSFEDKVNGNYELIVLNTLGQVVAQQTIQLNNTNHVDFALPQLMSGNIYYIKMSNGTENYFQKISVK